MRDLDMDNETPDLPDPEMLDVRVAHLRKLARRVLDAAGIQVGGDHLINPIVAAIQSECSSLRDRCAGMVLSLRERGITMDNPHARDDADPMGSLAINLRQHYVDHEGAIQVLLPDVER